ncbi:MAG: transporter substrate-binding domain-containing protein [Eubacterium sp.]|nr:transporter substrate-binding domain-containing protein [Eubacterium sp.]MDD7209862.1 transporter substrate-binding domain-containing protein [Lachnospiraceae bacterium]MDY5497946.1 transporter substrate-binding domain-containing protein [Anaerobutyricum sp.]
MKRLTAMLLALVMCVSCLAGCGSSKKEGSEAGSTSEATKDSDWAYVSGKGELTIGMTLFAPMNYYDDKNEFVGFDTELANAVGEKLGLKINFEEINWDAKETELNSKNIDCIWNGMCITPERKENMSISDPYLYNTQAMVMKKDREAEIMKDVSGLTVTAETGSTGEGKIQGTIPDDETVKVSAQDYFKDCNYVASDSMAKALMEVKSGTADIAVVDSVCALGMVGEGTDYEDLTINLDNNFGQQEYGIAFRKGSDITEKVNAAIKELYDDGTVDKIAQKYELQDMLIKK